MAKTSGPQTVRKYVKEWIEEPLDIIMFPLLGVVALVKWWPDNWSNLDYLTYGLSMILLGLYSIEKIWQGKDWICRIANKRSQAKESLNKLKT